MQQEYELDRLIRSAVTGATPSPSLLLARIERSLDGRRPRLFWPWRWPAFAGAALLVLLCALAIPRLAARHSMHLLCQDAADDHRSEVVLREPRLWHTGTEITAIAQRVVPSARIPQNLAGLPLEKARICGLLQARALHLVYGSGARQVSVFLMLRQDLPSDSLPPSAPAHPLHHEDDYGISVTTFAGNGLGIAIVGNSSLTGNVAAQLADVL